MTPTIRPSINKLTLLEPVGRDGRTDRQQARLVSDSEFGEMTLQGDLSGGEVAELGSCDVVGMFCAGADLDGEVSVLLTGLVGDDLDAIELEDGARDAFCGYGVVEGGHAFFYGEGSCAGREGVGFAFEGRGCRGFEDGETEADVESVGFDFWVEGFDCAGPGFWEGEGGEEEGGGEEGAGWGVEGRHCEERPVRREREIMCRALCKMGSIDNDGLACSFTIDS